MSGKAVAPVVIVAAFSRPVALRRLLESIEGAIYPEGEEIRLIISIDGGGSAEVAEIADRFEFSHGIKSVKHRDDNIGLREHILWCGDQTEEFGSVITLEDDLLVDRHYYSYARACLEFYKDDTSIAGIALYSPHQNEFVELPFTPLRDGSTGYLMQIACSWGQAWTAQQWSQFRNWLSSSTSASVSACHELPETVRGWPESSWKKHFCAYLVNRKKYFFYPFDSYTTNCSDRGGVHRKACTSLLQVPFRDQLRSLEGLNFLSSGECTIRYDAFMETDCEMARQAIGSQYEDIHFDFYGSKPRELLRSKRYVLTTRKVRKYIRRYKLVLRPFEMNLLLAQSECPDDRFVDHSSPDAYLIESEDIISDRVARIELAQYFSYFKLTDRTFIAQYVVAILGKIWAKIGALWR